MDKDKDRWLHERAPRPGALFRSLLHLLLLRTALPCTPPPLALQRRRRSIATRSMSASPVAAAAGSGSQYRVVRADLHDARHAAAFTACTQAYACDAMGGGKPLSDAVLARSAAALADWPTALILLAFEEASGDAAGVATCFRGWGTFQGAPLLNVHDLAVAPAHRRCVCSRDGRA